MYWCALGVVLFSCLWCCWSEIVDVDFVANEGNDDVQQNVNAGGFNRVALTLPLGFNNVFAAVRFRNVQIPPNTVIIDAKLTFENAVAVGNSGTVRWGGEAIGDAQSFLDQELVQDGRIATDSLVVVDVNPINAGEQLVFDGLAEIVQEIVDRDDWQEGNAMVLFSPPAQAGDVARRVFSADGAPNNQAFPKLTVTFDDGQNELDPAVIGAGIAGGLAAVAAIAFFASRTRSSSGNDSYKPKSVDGSNTPNGQGYGQANNMMAMQAPGFGNMYEPGFEGMNNMQGPGYGGMNNMQGSGYGYGGMDNMQGSGYGGMDNMQGSGYGGMDNMQGSGYGYGGMNNMPNKPVPPPVPPRRFRPITFISQRFSGLKRSRAPTPMASNHGRNHKGRRRDRRH